MIVVADTSPINYLVLIGAVDVLARLYPLGIVIPPAVFAELTHPAAPRAVQAWASNQPAWLTVVAPKNAIVAPRLDPGESEAIALAIEIRAAAVLIDDRAGCREASRRGLAVAGTLTVLDDADRAGLLKFDHAVARLLLTSFRVSQSVLAEIRLMRSAKP